MNKSVRLSDKEIKAIIYQFHQFFGEADHIWLFGSRVDLNKRGGDIDLYIETEYSNLENIAEKKIKFLVNLKNEIGDQKIDVIIKAKGMEKNLAIYAEAKNSGIKLT